MLSNNRTTFVSAAEELRDCIKAENQSDNEISLAQKDIKWIFNSPGAPQFGGKLNGWFKFFKKAKMTILDGISLTDDVLTTRMCLVEDALNHFLLGRDKSAIPILPDVHRYTGLRRVFQVSKFIHN